MIITFFSGVVPQATIRMAKKSKLKDFNIV
jgi:hypothetical protein